MERFYYENLADLSGKFYLSHTTIYGFYEISKDTPKEVDIPYGTNEELYMGLGSLKEEFYENFDFDEPDISDIIDGWKSSKELTMSFLRKYVGKNPNSTLNQDVYLESTIIPGTGKFYQFFEKQVREIYLVNGKIYVGEFLDYS